MSRQQFADAQPDRPGREGAIRPPILRGSIGLGVIRLEMTAAAAQPDNDHRRPFPSRWNRRLLAQPKQLRQCQGTEPRKARMHKLSSSTGSHVPPLIRTTHFIYI